MSRKKIALVNVFFHPQSIGGATRVVEDNFDVLVEQYGKEFELVVFTSDESMQDQPYLLDSYLYKGVRVYRSSIVFRENMDWHPEDKKMKKYNQQSDLCGIKNETDGSFLNFPHALLFLSLI